MTPKLIVIKTICPKCGGRQELYNGSICPECTGTGYVQGTITIDQLKKLLREDQTND